MVWRPTLEVDAAALHSRISTAPPLHEAAKGAGLARVSGRAYALAPLVVAPISGRKVVGYVFSGEFYDPDVNQHAPFSLFDLNPFVLRLGETRVEVLGDFPLVLRGDVSEADADAKELLIASDILAWLRKGRRTGSARQLPRVRWQEACIDEGEAITVWGHAQQGGASNQTHGYRDTTFRTIIVPPADGLAVITDLGRKALMGDLAEAALHSVRDL